MRASPPFLASASGSWRAFGRLVGLLACLATAAAVSPEAVAGQGLLGQACCFSRRAGLDCCSPSCRGLYCSDCGHRHPMRGFGRGRAGCRAVETLEAPAWSGPEAELDAALDTEFGPERTDTAAAPPEAPFESVAASFGAAARGADVLPSMVGDFFGGGITVFVPSLTDRQTLSTGVLPMGGGDRRFKLAENNSPFPADRAFFNYHYFNNAIRDVDESQFSLDRYTFGLEKTFFAERWSLEVRIPFAHGLDSTQVTNTPGLNSATEFGNIPLVVKHLLFRNDRWAAAIGMAVTLPTAADALITDDEGSLLLVENEAVHLQPFLGVHYAPNERFWSVFFAQADFDANGNTTTFSGDAFGGTSRGVLQDQNALYLDMAWGYWLYRDPCGGRLLSGIAPMLELHYSTTMQEGDIVRAPNGFDAVGGMSLNPEPTSSEDFTIGRRLDVLNLTAALRFQLGQQSMLTVAGVAPLRSGEDKLFDGELGVQYVWSY